MKAFRVSSKLTVHDLDPLVREHRVNQIHILPGVSMLDASYKTLAAAHCTLENCLLRQILFYEPVVTHAEMDRTLSVVIECDGKQGRITVNSLPSKNGKILSNNPTLHMTANLLIKEQFDLPDLAPLPSLAEAEDLDSCYAVTRKVGIFHEDFMQCTGTIELLPAGACLGRVNLQARAKARMADFLLHPVFLDCATIVPLFHLRHRLDDAILFIPFAIEEFRARSFAGLASMQVLVEKSEVGVLEQEILRYSASLFDNEGRALAKISNFGVKRVRSLEGIERLLASGNSARAAKPAAPAPAKKEVASATSQDPLHDLIGSLLANSSKTTWNDCDKERQFFELGLDSLALLDMAEALEKKLAIRLYPTLLFECPTVVQLAAHLRENFPEQVALAVAGAPPQNITAAPAKPAAPLPQPTASTPQILLPHWTPINEASPSNVGWATRPPIAPSPATPNINQNPAAAHDIFLAKEDENQSGGRVAHPTTPPGQNIALIVIAEDALWPNLLAAAGQPMLQIHASDAATALAQAQSALATCGHITELWLAGWQHEELFHLLKICQAQQQLPHIKQIKFTSRACFAVMGEPAQLQAAHGVWGMLQSLSREYAPMQVAQCDLPEKDEKQDEDQAALVAWLRSPATTARQLRALRGQQFYQRQLLPLKSQPNTQARWREGGVYLLIGGGSGLGLEFAHYLRQQCNAKVILLGRSERDAAWLQAHSSLGKLGQDWQYVPADLSDSKQMQQVIARIQQEFGALHGILHSAMVLDDQTFATMDAKSLARVLQPKVKGLQVLAEVSAGLSLDFLLLFSSIQSLIGNQQQANYASASSYLDGYALALASQRPYPVLVINWGSWSEIGAVATPVYRQLLARQGLYGLHSESAWPCLEQAMAAGCPQALILAAEENVLQEMGWQGGLQAAFAQEVSLIEAQTISLPEEILTTCNDDFVAIANALPALLTIARSHIAGVLAQMRASQVAVVREHTALVQVLEQQLQGVDVSEPANLAALDNLPALQHFVPLMRAALLAYPRILRGEISAFDAIFPQGSPELVRAVYGESAISQFYNHALVHALVQLAKTRQAAPLRIIEIGAGTGATTVAALLALQEAGIAVEYHYTELWDKLLLAAKQQYAERFPQLRFRFLDIGSAPQAQGVLEEFDIVIATNVLHATRDLPLTLRHCKHLLKRGGALLLNESVEVQDYSTYTFGLLPGWWSALDQRLPNSPLASSAQWQRLLREEGFHAVQEVVPARPEIPNLAAQQVFVAYSDGMQIRPQAKPAAQLVSPTLAQLRPFVFSAQAKQQNPGLAQLSLLQVLQDARGHGWILLNHAPANTFNHALLEQLCAVLEYFAASSDVPPCLYFSHVGNYFSLGGDRVEIMRRLTGTPEEQAQLRAFADLAKHLLDLLATMPMLVIAVLHGTAQGGGLETLLATDLQFVKSGVKLGLPEIQSGLIPGMGGLRYLQSKIGAARTKRLVLTGELISAEQAQAQGIISHVADDPYAAAFAWQEQMQQSHAALAMKKILALDDAALHSIDVDAWFAFLLQNTAQINAQRIENADVLLGSRQQNTR